MRFTKALLFTLGCFFGLSLQAQDIHFSLFNYSPLTLNPAFTGAYEGSFRIGGIYRDQWASRLPNQFVTPSFFVDAPVLAIGKGDWIGVGGMTYQDKVGAGNLRNNSFQFSAAYHKALGKGGKTTLTLGVQGGQSQRKFDPTSPELIYEDELDLGGGLGSGNGVDRNRVGDQASYFDLNAGLLLRSQVDEGMDFNVGFALQHLITPEYNLITANNTDNELPMRISAHGQLNADIGEKWMVSPTILFLNLNPATQFAVQGWGGYYLKPERDIILKAGLGYRVGSSGEVLLGIDYKAFKVAASYDINFSELGAVTYNRGGFEIAATYIARIYKKPTVKPVILCPKL